ncbi:retrotransposon protein, putative, ty1-copia subclass [Tanacetum coccineum]
MTTTVVNNLLFRTFFEKQKLTGINFMEWYRNLWIVLSVEDKLPFLEQPILAMPVPPAGQIFSLDVLNTHTAWVKASKEIIGLMLMTMDPDIQKNLEQLGAYDMLKELKMLYAQQSYIDNLECLGHAMTQNLSVSLILVSLRKEYDGFVQNYNMHNMGKTMTELHAILKLHEQTLPPKEAAPALHAIRAGRIQKNQKRKSHKTTKGNQGKDKAKMGYAPVPAPFFTPKPKNPPTPKKDNPTKDAICYQCGEVGHWRRNSPVYLAKLMKNKKLSQGASTSGALSLYVGDGHRAAVEAIREFHLCLPSGLVLILHNCHYAPSITRGIISVSCLYKDGFVNRFENDNSISVSRNNLIYFNAISRDDIYEIDLSSSNTNDSYMYAKRMEKLQQDGLLDLTDIQSFEKCVSCMSRKMARKPYSHQVERAKDLLGLIYTDEVENQLEKTIKLLCSDREGEYMSQEFLDHLKEHGIISHRTPPYTQQYNGVSKRRNRTLLDMVRSMMRQTTLPKSFWDYALESVVRILNMVPTKKVEKTPYEVWHGQAPKLSYLKVWGCEALVKRDTLTKPNKLDPKSIMYIFVGYPKETMGYSFYYPPENKVFVAWNDKFLENSLIAQEASGSLEDLEIIQEEDTHPSIDTSLNHEEDDQEIYIPQSDINPIHRSTRTCRPTDQLYPKSDKWLNAMNVEMQSMRDNKVWELVDLPPKGKTIGHKWLFKKKTDMDGAVHTYKARLVTKGFTQIPGIDYEETFSPVADIRAIRILIAIIAFYDYEIWQMDVKTAFLNGYFNEEVYMEQPEGFSIKNILTDQNCDEPCVYVKASGSYVTFLILYVDDILIMGNNIPMLQDVKSYLGRCFAMKDLGEAALMCAKTHIFITP